MFPVVNIGPLAIQTPGLILLLGIWLGLTFSEKQAGKANVDSNLLYNLVLIGLLTGLLGARLTFAALHLNAFINTPLNLIALTATMLDPYGGVLIGSLSMFIYGQRKKLTLYPVLDALTPFLMVMQIMISLANLASGEGYGLPTNMPWGIELWGAIRHPSQIYEIIAGLIILGLVWRYRSPKDVPGMTFFRFLALSAATRLFLEAYREDTILLAANVRLAQLVAWGLLALAFWKLGHLIRQQSEVQDESER